MRFKDLLKAILDCAKYILVVFLWSALVGLILCLFMTSEVFAMPLDEPCGLTEEELAGNLKYELKQYADDFLEAEEKYGVNAAFLCAVASHESGHGRYMFRENNIFGWGGKSFDSVPECIDFVASKLKANYIDPDGKYYRGGDIADIGKIYCPNDDRWVEAVEHLTESIAQKNKQRFEHGIIRVYIK